LQIERLKERFEHEAIEAVYSSDLSRTCVTASAIYESHGLPLIKTEKLREVKMGDWEDLPWGDIEYYDPEMNVFFSKDPAKWHAGDSDSFCDVQERMMECITKVARQHDGGTVAVFSHGFAIRAFFCAISGFQSHEIKQIPYCDNTAVSLLRYDIGNLTIEYQGDNSHLSKELSTFANQSWWRSEKKWAYENLRFMPYDEYRDSTIKAEHRMESGKENTASKEYTALMGDEPIGIIGLDITDGYREDEACAPISERDGKIGWIEYIFVRPQMRDHNFGVQLLGQAVSVFRHLMFGKLRIRLPKHCPSSGFFRKYGFTELEEDDHRCILEKDIKNWT